MVGLLEQRGKPKYVKRKALAWHWKVEVKCYNLSCETLFIGTMLDLE
jgi:hypothetical protein